MRNRIQHLGHCGSGSIASMTKIFTAEKNPSFFYLRLHEDVQVTEEAFIPQKRTSSTLKHEISLLFSILWATSALLDPDPSYQNQCGSMRFRIHNTGTNIPKFKCCFTFCVLKLILSYTKGNPRNTCLKESKIFLNQVITGTEASVGRLSRNITF
jgi:hypothetical protein